MDELDGSEGAKRTIEDQSKAGWKVDLLLSITSVNRQAEIKDRLCEELVVFETLKDLLNDHSILNRITLLMKKHELNEPIFNILASAFTFNVHSNQDVVTTNFSQILSSYKSEVFKLKNCILRKYEMKDEERRSMELRLLNANNYLKSLLKDILYEGKLESGIENDLKTHEPLKMSKYEEYFTAVELEDENAMSFPGEIDFLVDLEPDFQVVQLTELELSTYKHLDPERKSSKLKYRMCNDPRGPCLILNYAKYSNGERRDGSAIDVRYVVRLFEQLHFEAEVHNNLTLPKTMLVLNQFIQKLKHSTFLDACVLVVLGHGSDDFVYTFDYLKLNLERDVLDQFENVIPGKPKLFLFQCCRGERHNVVLIDTEETSRSNDSVEQVTKAEQLTTWFENLSRKFYKKKKKTTYMEEDAALFTKEPMRSDMFIWYSTQPSFVSFRYPKLGSVFLQTVASVLCRAAWCYDVSRMAVMVNGVLNQRLKMWRVKIEHDDDCENEKSIDGLPIFQTPYSSNHLRKQLYFYPGYIKCANDR